MSKRILTLDRQVAAFKTDIKVVLLLHNLFTGFTHQMSDLFLVIYFIVHLLSRLNHINFQLIVIGVIYGLYSDNP